MKKDFGEIFSAEIISIVGGVIAGSLLSMSTGRLELIPGILILLPGFLGMRNNISGSLSARLGSSLHMGTLKPKLKNTRILRENILAVVFLAFVISTFLGFLSYSLTRIFFGIDFQLIIIISILSGLLSNLIEIPITVFTSFFLYARGHDPDNIMGPYITTLGDVINVVSLLVVIMVMV